MASPTTTEVPAAKKPRNGFAVAALIFGVLGGVLFGLLFGFLGLSRARKVGTGRGMAWAGIAFSLLWIAGGAAVFLTIGPNLLKAANPGCVAAKDVLGNTAKLTAGGTPSGPTSCPSRTGWRRPPPAAPTPTPPMRSGTSPTTTSSSSTRSTATCRSGRT